MGKSRPRYNAKGRNLEQPVSQLEDTNVDILQPTSHEEKLKRRAELLAAKGSNGKAPSAKKKKRLDAYIDKKLRQERRQDLLKELGTLQSNIPENVQFTSSSSLGSRQLYSAQSKMNKKLELQSRKKDRLKMNRSNVYQSDDDVSSGEDSATDIKEPERVLEPVLPAASASTRASTNTEPDKKPANVQSTPVLGSGLGSGLKRTADGALPVPIVVKRRKTAWGRLPVRDAYEAEESSDFDSSDSAYDDSDDMDDSDGSANEEASNDDHVDDDASDAGTWKGCSSSESQSESESEGEGESEKDQDESSHAGQRSERGTFKDWAQQQRNLLEGYNPDAPPMIDVVQSALPESAKPKSKKAPSDGILRGPLGKDLAMPASDLAPGKAAQPKARVIQRSEATQEGRLKLPILAEEDNIMFAIRHNAVTVLCGETGSGKTTQVPQFLYEAGWASDDPTHENSGMIGITQPRRVAAVSMARRVAEELGLDANTQQVVAHQIRYDTTVSKQTKIKFMTDGVLLRELATDFLLSKYSVIMVDEAHERSINTDILLGVLSRVVKLRQDMWKQKEGDIKPLRLVIMSATLRLTDFINNTALFPQKPQVINVAARQFPITMHFARRTRSDYLQEAYKKVCKIHARLPPGGILVFLTGQGEIQTLCRKLEKKYGRNKSHSNMGQSEDARSRDVKSDGRVRDVEPEELDLGENVDLAADVDDAAGDVIEDDPEALDTDTDEEDDHDAMWDDEEQTDLPLHILPLYSLLPAERQMRVFEPVPENCRLVVVATNVAETSLTIPGIRYVIDCGRAKERHFDSKSNMQSFQVSWISKASAAQRSGRAGRSGPGHCYRLYSSAVYEQYLDDHTTPEILRMPIDSMVLQMKSMNIDNVVNFPFPTAPDREALRHAEQLLVHLGALQHSSKTRSADSAKITDLGRAMSLFPLPPRFSKMLVTGHQQGALAYVVAIVCALTVGDPFLREDAVGMDFDQERQDEDEDVPMEIANIKDPSLKEKEIRKQRRKAYFQALGKFALLGNGTSDVFKLLSAVGAYEFENGSLEFCEANFLRSKAMSEIHKLRAQITQLVSLYYPKVLLSFDPKLPPPSDVQLKAIRQLICASFADHIAVRADLIDPAQKQDGPGARVAYKALFLNEDAFIHPSSTLFTTFPAPEYICFQELFKSNKPWLKTVTKIAPAWLSSLAKPFCTFTKVLETPDKLVVNGLSADGQTRQVYVVPRFGDGSFEIELRPIKMEQHRVNGRWVF